MQYSAAVRDRAHLAAQLLKWSVVLEDCQSVNGLRLLDVRDAVKTGRNLITMVARLNLKSYLRIWGLPEYRPIKAHFDYAALLSNAGD